MYQDIEFRHGLYDFQGHHAGTKLGRSDAAEQAIVDLVDGADMALYRKEGYFFDAIDDRTFVFGRLVEWNSVRSGECFFDLYATPLDNLRDVSVNDLANELFERSQRITEKQQSVEPTVTVSVRVDGDGPGATAGGSGVDPHAESETSRTETSRSDRDRLGESDPDANATDRAGEGGPDDAVPNRAAEERGRGNDGTPDAPSADAAAGSVESDETSDVGSPDEDPNAPPTERTDAISDDDVEFVAQFWERYRRGTDPVTVSIDGVDRMARLVDGTLSNVRFVSRVDDEGDPYHFDVVGGESGEPYDVSELVEAIRAAAADGTLTWEDLPTYEEELNELIERHSEYLRPTFKQATDRDEFGMPPEAFRDHFDAKRATGLDESKVGFYWDLWTAFVDDYWTTLATFEAVVQRRAAETLADAVDPSVGLVDEGEAEGGRFIDRVSGLVTGGDERGTDAGVARNVDVNHVDDEEIDAVTRRLSEVAFEEACERLDGPVSDELRERLRQRTERISVETVRRLDEIRGSRAYRETYRDRRGSGE
ncbi:hypothetical protein E4P24_16130 [Haloferax sp. AS1]|uniref:hypothetical protein n=1 Tax=Haloferax TaxID=2251 RepID=UPI00165F61AD|nr:hypothetical protein [Haloferax sp. AS1]MBC9987884.1 hypothetical protein [Haloferax sp. AS1]